MFRLIVRTRQRIASAGQLHSIGKRIKLGINRRKGRYHGLIIHKSIVPVGTRNKGIKIRETWYTTGRRAASDKYVNEDQELGRR